MTEEFKSLVRAVEQLFYAVDFIRCATPTDNNENDLGKAEQCIDEAWNLLGPLVEQLPQHQRAKDG